MSNRIVLCAAAVAASSAACLAADTTNAFTVGVEGWFVANVNPAAHISTDPAQVAVGWDGAFGLPAGSLRVQDIYSWTYVGAPASHLGNYAGSFGGQISADIYIRLTDDAEWPAFALRGKNISLYYPLQSPPLNTWTTMSAPLTGAGWKVNNYSAAADATDADMLEVLSDLRGIYVLLEWRTGGDDTNMDNFFMTGTPGPVCPGDINGDGFTNAADFTILAGQFGGAVPPNTLGDLDGDGFVNAADFVILAGDFGCAP